MSERSKPATLDPSLAELARWLNGARDRIVAQVTVRQEHRASGRETLVTIDHRLSCDLPLHAGWHVRTRPTVLPRAHFSSWAIARVKSAEQRRGRAIYCHDLTLQEVTAAASYHVDTSKRLPLLLTTLAFRTDIDDNPYLRYRTLAGALVLKHELHAVADLIGRGGCVDIDLADKDRLDAARELGFRSAPRIKGFRPGGVHLRQDAPVTTSE